MIQGFFQLIRGLAMGVVNETDAIENENENRVEKDAIENENEFEKIPSHFTRMSLV
jgi:hypothetical protein